MSTSEIKMVYSVMNYKTEAEALAMAKAMNAANKANGWPTTWAPVQRYGGWSVGRPE